MKMRVHPSKLQQNGWRGSTRLVSQRAGAAGIEIVCRDKGIITPAEEKFFSAIYTLISAEATHKFDAPKETILVLQRTVADYLCLLFKRLSDWKVRSGFPVEGASYRQKAEQLQAQLEAAKQELSEYKCPYCGDSIVRKAIHST